MYHATDFQYNKQGELWFVTRRHWEAADEYCENQVIDQILEVRGSGRARHVARERDLTNNDQIVLGTAVWSDYDGDVIYGDYTAEWVEVEPDVWELEVEDRTAYLPGIGQLDNATGNVMYYHGDQIGSLRAVTTCAVGAEECIPGETATVLQRPVYTAFGELVYDLAPQDTRVRYRYAGDWGYEGRLGSETNGGSDAASGLPYTHVGHRWYNPASGRFLQRDPIGILDGLNVYRYVGNNPLTWIDPLGLGGNPHDIDAGTQAGMEIAETRSATGGADVATWVGAAASAAHRDHPDIAAAGVSRIICGFTKHGIDQIINRGIRPEALHDAVDNPLKIYLGPDGTIKFVGRAATVVVNADGEVVTAWGRGRL